MNIAIQIGGELRNWETAYTLFSIYEKICKEQKIEVDFFGCFWESDYTSYCNEKKFFGIFKSISILPVPSIGITTGRKKGMEENNTGRSLNLYNWSYASYITSKLRREYQWEKKPFDFEYDFVIYTRPDVYVPYDYWKHLPSKLKSFKFTYTLHTPPIIKNINDVGHISGWPCCGGEDIKMSGDEGGMNLFAFGILPLYIDKNPSFVATYHNTPCLTISKFNLGIYPTLEPYENWQILRKNDCESITDKFNIEDKYSKFIEFQNMKNFLKENKFEYEK